MYTHSHSHYTPLYTLLIYTRPIIIHTHSCPISTLFFFRLRKVLGQYERKVQDESQMNNLLKEENKALHSG